MLNDLESAMVTQGYFSYCSYC